VSAGAESSYTCGPAARWLPRTLAGAVLVAGLLASAHVDAALPGARTLRALLVVVAAIAALWVVRKAGEVRFRVTAGATRLTFEHRAHSASLLYEDIDAIRFEAPFGASRSWLPATVLVDRQGRDWRLCALLSSGDRLVGDIVVGSGREGLATWADEHHVRQRMARSHLRVRLGYAVALVVLLAPALLYLR
jgi:hypothetical protein